MRDTKKEQVLSITSSQSDRFISQNDVTVSRSRLLSTTQISQSDCEITSDCGKKKFFITLPTVFPQGSGEQSQELYTFHEAVSQLQDAEDKLVDDHRKNIEVSKTCTCFASH